MDLGDVCARRWRRYIAFVDCFVRRDNVGGI